MIRLRSCAAPVCPGHTHTPRAAFLPAGPRARASESGGKKAESQARRRRSGGRGCGDNGARSGHRRRRRQRSEPEREETPVGVPVAVAFWGLRLPGQGVCRQSPLRMNDDNDDADDAGLSHFACDKQATFRFERSSVQTSLPWMESAQPSRDDSVLNSAPAPTHVQHKPKHKHQMAGDTSAVAPVQRRKRWDTQ